MTREWPACLLYCWWMQYNYQKAIRNDACVCLLSQYELSKVSSMSAIFFLSQLFGCVLNQFFIFASSSRPTFSSFHYYVTCNSVVEPGNTNFCLSPFLKYQNTQTENRNRMSDAETHFLIDFPQTFRNKVACAYNRFYYICDICFYISF